MYGYINEDGEFVSNEETTKATKCAFCGNVTEEIEDEHGIQTTPTELINPRVFEELRGDFTGGEPACPECIKNGVGEPYEDWDPEDIFDEAEEESVEL